MAASGTRLADDARAPVVIRGWGLVLPGVRSPDELWDRVRLGRPGYRGAGWVSPFVRGTLPYGAPAEAEYAHAAGLLPPKLRRCASRAVSLTPLALARALADAGVALADVAPGRRALFTAENDHAAPFEVAVRAIQAAGRHPPAAREAVLGAAGLGERGLDPFGVIKSCYNAALIVNSIVHQTRACGGAFSGGVGAVRAALGSASRALRRGECDLALVLAVDSHADPLFLGHALGRGWISTAAQGAQGEADCLPVLSGRADGTVWGCAAAALVLQRAADADGADIGFAPAPCAAPDAVVLGADGRAAQDDEEVAWWRRRLARPVPVTGARFCLGNLGGAGWLADLCLAHAMLRRQALPAWHPPGMPHARGAAALHRVASSVNDEGEVMSLVLGRP